MIYYKNRIFEIRGVENYNTTKKLFKKLKHEINNISHVFRKIIIKKILSTFWKIVNYLKDQNITKMSNKIENYLRTTLSKLIKRTFKII